MQARAIGGFLFSEQFPWSILEEVLRGCREYNFRGSKICEFTPVDPELSYELEEMIENDTVPEGWGIYRANTECAMEAGHVSESWFREFFGMVPEEMRETRMTGRFASYEGAVFQSLNPLVHYVDDDFMFPGGNFPSNVFHRRGKDWGAGPDNADACVWGYKNGKGQWFIYDEYVSTDQNYTVHDHLKAISDKWWWPQNNPHYGMMYADPSDQGNIRIASRFSEYHPEYDNFSIQNASNRVFEGIDYIRWLLKPDKALGGQPRLFVHKKNCPYLCRTLRTYRWERSNENSLNPRSAKPQPLKKDDHAVDALRYMVFSDANRTGTIPESMERKRDRKRHGVQVAGGRGR
jgi:hypothetical protein